MKTILHLLAVPALFAGGTFAVAQDAPRVSGQVLLLRSERTLEGEITKVGTQYRVRRGGSESWVAGDQAARLFADWDEAYRFMRSRANLGDPDERLRLARWCRLNRLTKAALAEATAALEMRPAHGPTKQLVMHLERSLAGPAAAPQAAEPTPAPAPLAAVDVSPETLITFTARVQPILLNACVGCHAAGRGGSFQLVRGGDGGQRAATMQNLAAALAHANLGQPGLSPLLIKATSPHGGAAAAPLTTRQAVAYQTLERWLANTAAGNPHLVTAAPPRLAPAVTATAPPLAPPAVPTEGAPAVAPRTEPAPDAGVVPAVARSAVPASPMPAAAPMPPTAVDPFDPAVFNQQAHPDR